MITNDRLPGDFYAIALQRGKERYVWLYSADKVIDLFSSFGVYAALQCYAFTWIDAANLRAKVLAELAKESGVKR